MARSRLSSCSSCKGFVPASAALCPHCRAPQETSAFARLRLGVLGGALGGGALAFTLMACYGCPPGQCGGPPTDSGEGLGDAGTNAPSPMSEDPNAKKDGG
jgi:hypothetical protein